MNDEEAKMIEHRITKMEVLVESLYHRSDERLNVINDRFDGVDRGLDKAERRSNWFWTLVFTATITVGGVYLESVFNKEDEYRPLAIVSTRGM